MVGVHPLQRRVGQGLRHRHRMHLQFDPGFDPATIEHRPSAKGNYLGLTITINATSREQLDELYRTLTTHPMVKMVI